MTYGELLLDVKQDLGIVGDQGMALSHLNNAFRMFWDFVPWKETLGEMEPFFPIPGWSVYREPFISLPDDFRDVFSAEYMRLSDDGSMTWRRLETIGNMQPGSYGGEIEAVGYSFEYKAILLDRFSYGTLGLDFISIIYKKDYPYDLTADNAAAQEFPFLRNEGNFRVILGWHLRGKQEKDFPMVARAMQTALIAETPGKQTATQPPEGRFSGLGYGSSGRPFGLY